MTKSPDDPSDVNAWTSQLHSWTAHHFTISDEHGDVPLLLRRVAGALDELAQYEVLDVTFCQEVEGAEFSVKMTVYLTLPD